MKHNYLKHLFTALLMLCATVATAHDFVMGGIYYNILSEENKTVEVTYRGYYYFSYDDEYTGSVVIPESVTYNGTTYSVTSIESYAFYDCSGLKSITIPNSVTSIGDYAFSGTAWYNNQPDGVVYAGKVLYNYKGTMPSNTSITIKDGTLGIAYRAFYKCTRLTSIEIPNSVTSIGDGAFASCDGLTNIEIPNSVTSIGEGAFEGCIWLTSITIPNSVTSIGDGAFSECENIRSISVESGNTIYDSRENCNAIIETETNTLIAGCQNTIIPNSVTSIGRYAFLYCSCLTSIVIPNSVTSIGMGAFSYCYGLTSIEIPNSVTSIGDVAFSDCICLESVVIGNSVTSIGDMAFAYCSGLTSITSLIPADNLFTPDIAFHDVNKTNCTLYVPFGTKDTYAATEGWNEFTNIVELEKPITEVTVTIGQYGCATYCSPYAIDFSEVEELKAYAATGYKSNSQVVTLTRVQTAEAGIGLFLKGEPGEYVVPVIESTDEHSLNMLVGTLEQTVVNSTDGAMSNYKFTIAEGDEAPMFYPFEDGTTLSAGKAYLQIPTAWLPTTAQKSVSIRFDEGETTDIDEVKGQSGEVKTVYDLQGRVVENPTSGIYIIDGKKVVIK